MATEFDPAEFVDQDYQPGGRRAAAGGTTAAAATSAVGVAPTREEIDARVGDMQSKLAELKRVQQELERERTELEETRRRQAELTRGRQEMEQHLTRGVGLLEEAEFATRREAEQMAKALADLREALAKVQSVNEESWTKDNLNTELTRALTIVENARMEWNSARLKFDVLNPDAAARLPAAAGGPAPVPGETLESFLHRKSYGELCKLGFALTWPVAVAALAIFLVLLRR
ncbi:MAG: hypothetical protein RJA22_454 [Verrucomicrobiota bacterium]|jgi:septal ring factor EnvC (AmiA/AmiB activator)